MCSVQKALEGVVIVIVVLFIIFVHTLHTYIHTYMSCVERERQRDRETERQRDRETERHREK